jgi:uncharacterized Zn finger protein (UPF0148 family)
MVELYCPRCGTVMGLMEGQVACLRGDMALSGVMTSELQAIAESSPSRPEPANFVWGGSWYCPADGERMVEESGLVRCPACERYLPGRVLYALIELHPHKKV